MKRIFFVTLSALLIYSINLHTKPKSFKLVQQWKHSETIYGYIVDPGFIIDDESLVLHFYRTGLRFVSKEKFINIAPYGEGPNEVKSLFALFPVSSSEMAFVESPTKLKIFSKKNGSYKETKQVWIQRDFYHYHILDGFYYGNKLLLGGVEVVPVDNKPVAKHVKVYNEKGKIEKRLIISKDVSMIKNPYEMQYFLKLDEKRNLGYFVKENTLTLYPIDLKTLTEKKAVNLEVPSCYKKELPECFVVKKKFDPNYDKRKDKEKWRTIFSRINQVSVDGHDLVIQIRTPGQNAKKFALLFYNLDNYKLRHIEPTDDFFLGSRNGKFYFYANGDPTLDDGTDTCTINIYRFQENKK